MHLLLYGSLALLTDSTSAVSTRDFMSCKSPLSITLMLTQKIQTHDRLFDRLNGPCLFETFVYVQAS